MRWPMIYDQRAMDWLAPRGGSSQRLDVDEELTVGRGQPGLGSIADDTEMSRRHARFTRHASGSLIVEDLGSANGTLVNGRTIAQPTRLRPGDVVQLGGTELEVGGDQPTTVRAAPAPEPVAAAPAGPSYAAPRSRDTRVVVLGTLLALALIGLIASLVLAGGGDDGGAAGAEPPFDGTVYALTNRVAPGENTVVAVRYRGSSFAPLRMREYPTGGSGSTLVGANKAVPVAVDGDQQIQVDRKRKLLFAVNQGTDSIAVFRIGDDGVLTAVPGSPFRSGGVGPISVGLSADTVIVVNKGADGQRKVPNQGTVVQFQLTDDGKLTPIGTPRRLPPGAGPAQALVVDRADFAIVPELVGGPYRTMIRGAQGTFRSGPTTPVTQAQRDLGTPLRDALVAIAPPGTKIPARLPTPPQGAQGMSLHPEQDLVYSTLPPFSLLAVHSFDRSGNLRFVRGTKIQGGLLACWSKVSADGRTLYVSVAATHTVAVFDLTDPENPKQIQSLQLDGLGGHTFNLELDPSGKRLFVLDSWEPTFDQPGFGNQLHVLDIGQAGMLSTPKRGALARMPVLNGTSTYGLAVVPRVASSDQS
jgi:6-phosphogluconolactonase (cycloisomerase 2 family)